VRSWRVEAGAGERSGLLLRTSNGVTARREEGISATSLGAEGGGGGGGGTPTGKEGGSNRGLARRSQ